MASTPNQPVVVVVGAGAAGLAAGWELVRRQVPFLVLEARQRIGGRAHTSRVAGGHLVDLGCEWLHSADRNILARLAASKGLRLDKSLPPWRKRNEQVGFDQAAQADFDVASNAFFDRLELAAHTERDGPASALLEPGNRWNGLLDAISTYYNGAPLGRVSILDFGRYIDTEVNWRVIGGLGALVETLAGDLPIHVGCRVSAIELGGRAIRIETDQGAITAEKAIVTVPTNVIASGAIRFDSKLDDHCAAAANLPLGLADKVFLSLDAAEAFAPDTRLLGTIDRTDGGSYTLRSQGLPIVEGYFGGDYARELERGGMTAFADAARREITAALGHDIGGRLTPIAATAWAQDPFAQGSYSHALPGFADARAELARPVDGRLVFVGEATSRDFFSTAHGAWEEGARAVRRLFDGSRSARDADDTLCERA